MTRGRSSIRDVWRGWGARLGRWGVAAVLGFVAAATASCAASPAEDVMVTAGPTDTSSQPARRPTPSPWASFAFGGGLEFEIFDSLDSMIRSADVTVLATVKSGELGDRFVDAAPGEEAMVDINVELRLSVDEVLAGEIVDQGKSVTLIMGPYDREETSATPWEPLIGQQAVFVLRRNGVETVGQWSTLPADPALLVTDTYHLVYSGGLLDEAPNAGTRAPMAEELGWIKKVTRRPFEDVLDSIRAAGR